MRPMRTHDVGMLTRQHERTVLRADRNSKFVFETKSSLPRKKQNKKAMSSQTSFGFFAVAVAFAGTPAAAINPLCRLLAIVVL
jgi:hypothetical protein